MRAWGDVIHLVFIHNISREKNKKYNRKIMMTLLLYTCYICEKEIERVCSIVCVCVWDAWLCVRFYGGLWCDDGGGGCCFVACVYLLARHLISLSDRQQYFSFVDQFAVFSERRRRRHTVIGFLSRLL